MAPASPHPLRLSILLSGLLSAMPLFAQDAPPAEGTQELIDLNLPAELELELLVTLVSQELELQVLYDQGIARERVTLKAPKQVPRSLLLSILRSALRMKGLSLRESDTEGWLEIVKAEELTRVASVPRAEEASESSSRAQTRVFELEHSSSQRIDPVIQKFLTQPGGNTTVSELQRLDAVSDRANARRDRRRTVGSRPRSTPRSSAVERDRHNHALHRPFSIQGTGWHRRADTGRRKETKSGGGNGRRGKASSGRGVAGRRTTRRDQSAA